MSPAFFLNAMENDIFYNQLVVKIGLYFSYRFGTREFGTNITLMFKAFWIFFM